MVTVFTDFDGVLFDTLKEAYVLCRKVFYDVDTSKAIEKNIFKKFERYKFLVFNSWQYLYLMKVLSDKHIKTDEDFVRNYAYMLKTRDFREEKEFEAKYLELRKDLIKNHSFFVDKLEEKFSFFDMLMSLKDKFEIVIISRNNNFEIARKLEKENIKGIKVVAKEELIKFKNKAEFIEQYMSKNKIDKAYFIDDNSHNLYPCKEIKNLKCLLAGWGNVGINEKGYTQELAIKTIQK